MTQPRRVLLSDLLPEKSKALLSGTGKDFVDRIGDAAIKKATTEVLCGENLRDQTEPLTRRRISQICGALVAMFANGWILQKDFTTQMSALAAEEMATKRRAKTDGWPARWTLGLTDKLADNVLRGDAKHLPKYIKAFEEAIAESSTRCAEDCGPLTMRLSLPNTRQSTRNLDWEEITRLTTALGCAALTIRGSDKSIYGKLFERLVLGSVLTILGFNCVKRSDQHSKNMVFWLSDSETGDRECDATAMLSPGKVIRFDIGFIGRGNPEITKDKISRFSRAIEIDGKKTSAMNVVIIDRLPKKGSTELSAEAIGTQIVQMSHKYWPRELALKLHKRTKSFQHPLLKMEETRIGAYLSTAMKDIRIEEFIGKLEIAKIEMEHDEGAADEVDATIRIDLED